MDQPDPGPLDERARHALTEAVGRLLDATRFPVDAVASRGAPGGHELKTLLLPDGGQGHRDGQGGHAADDDGPAGKGRTAKSHSSSTGSGQGGEAATPVDVVYQVAGMSQPTDHSCWATAFAVVINYRDGSNLTPAHVSNAVGVDIHATETWNDVTRAAKHFHLRQSASACMNIKGWAQLLSAYGPLWICVNGGSHAVVVHGVKGDGTVRGTSFYVADPWAGPETMNHKGLETMFEALDAQQPGDGLIIWHA